MASNLTFGLVVISEVNEMLVLLAQAIALFYMSYYFWASEDTLQKALLLTGRNQFIATQCN